MSDAPLYTIPTFDLSVKSLVRICQLGLFFSFAYWSVEGGVDENVDYVFFAVMASAGLALLLSVPNARMAITLGIPAVMVVIGLATGENEMMFWAFFMVIMLGSIVYLPAMADGDSALGLDDETRMQRFGILWIVFALLMILLGAQLANMAIEGEVTDEDTDGNEYTMVLDSTQQTIAQAGLALAVIGILVFLLTTLMGMELGPMRPWHGGAMVGFAMLISQYLWTVAEGAIEQGASDYLFILCLVGIVSMTPCIAYEGGDSD
tara:strand:+ start:117 stop:905 length:789 start_codon:yes stop_codon:yes gene_type:complete